MRACIVGVLIFAINLILLASNAGDWLEIAPDARALGMGSAQIAGVNGAYAAFWNPASRSRTTEIGSTFALLHGQVNYQYFGATNSFAYGKLGLGYMRVGMDGLEKTGLSSAIRPVVIGNNFSVVNSVLLVSFSENLGRLTGLTSSPFSALDFGITGKIVNEVIDNETASGLGIDLGLQMFLNQQLQLAAVVYNTLPPVIAWSTGTKEVFPTKLKLGLRYAPLQSLFLTADTDIAGYQQLSLHLGTEYWINSFLALRGGFDKEVLSMGLGIAYEGFKFDYAYTMSANSYMDASSRFSMGFALQNSQTLVSAAY